MKLKLKSDYELVIEFIVMLKSSVDKRNLDEASIVVDSGCAAALMLSSSGQDKAVSIS